MDQTVPTWLLSAAGKLNLPKSPNGKQATKPDTIILEGWPQNAPLPTGPTTHYTAPNGKRTRLTLHIVELGFSSDLKHQDKYDQKTAHYTPLITELSQEGWNVHPEAHVITIGVRATVPDRNHKVLQTLGITKDKDRKQLQIQFVHTSAKHHAMIITQIRKQTRIVGKQGVG